jgi:type I restriction enzyme S subunit
LGRSRKTTDRNRNQKLVALSGGAARNNINQQIVRAFPVVMPTSLVMQHFSSQVQPLFNQWLGLEKQNKRLAKARDLLLPRLMNGEIPV